MKNVIMSSIVNKDNKDAGPKAKNDIEKILIKEGFEPLNLELSRNKVKKLLYALIGLNKVFRGKKIDNLVFQYPIYSIFLTQRFIRAIRKYTKAKIYFIVHDIESLRAYKGDSSYQKKELAIFNSTDGMVVHNAAMHQWLQENGVTVPLEELGIFDYLNPNAEQESFFYDQSICFAGNLKGAGFLQRINLKASRLDLFGPNQASVYPKNINYQGIYPADQLPKYLKTNFGLVWNGDSLTRCDGDFGEYMKYNMPHKTSLYLSSGIPVIVWKKAAAAKFIEVNQVGLAVADLNELDQVLTKIDQQQYQSYKQNALKIGKLLRNGSFIKKAIRNLMQQTAGTRN
ncbi:sugar transferase [Liquorilactobacillus nagelii]|jgi:hypothetical protein|uniref:sugar transferase n=1 Tax=Liquorilactobacillus nagelii TaxID=82688 RepID=UPI0006EF0EF2|nr:sugar transferase [Liquorilactobacillus nagelii]KRL41195.1 galactofuranosyltransferase [Liquorilactobacillus nagelii DSM 13675]QYH54918.1 sugar transferase [Liquorilactobacillus nagelii DSM 13675]ULQ48880.1 sugar transferase [Liquorilactobacillus nagelii]